MIKADIVSLGLFILLMVLTLGTGIFKVYKLDGFKKWIKLYAVVIVVLAIATISGHVEENMIPMGPILILHSTIFAITLSFSKFGKNIATNLSFVALLGYQGFRFPLELILHKWSGLGVIPETMTWTGQNIDILAGIVCLLLIPFYKKSIAAVWAAQIIGFGLLLNVIRVAIMSAPFPFSWQLETPLEVIAHFPYALIVPCFVAVALICHLIVFRKLLNK